MKVINGFIIGSEVDPDTKEEKMIPFFPFVRSQDIILTNPIEIDLSLKKMSERWRLYNVEDRLHYTSYTFKVKYESLTHSDNGEPIGSLDLIGEVKYIFQKSGELTVTGVCRSTGDRQTDLEGESLSNMDKTLLTKTIYLPYNIPTDDLLTVKASYPYGNINGVSMIGTIDKNKILNVNLNPNVDIGGGDITEYYNKLTFKVFCQESDSIQNDLSFAYKFADRKFSDIGYNDYINKYLPIEFTIDTKWK